MNPPPIDPGSFWILFWQWVLLIGLGSFFVLVLVVTPLGVRDIRRLFERLDSGDEG